MLADMALISASLVSASFRFLLDLRLDISCALLLCNVGTRCQSWVLSGVWIFDCTCFSATESPFLIKFGGIGGTGGRSALPRTLILSSRPEVKLYARLFSAFLESLDGLRLPRLVVLFFRLPGPVDVVSSPLSLATSGSRPVRGISSERKALRAYLRFSLLRKGHRPIFPSTLSSRKMLCPFARSQARIAVAPCGPVQAPKFAIHSRDSIHDTLRLIKASSV